MNSSADACGFWRRRTKLYGLIVAFWVGAAFLLYLSADETTVVHDDTCVYCRLIRHVERTVRDGSTAVKGYEATLCSEWVSQNWPAHEHQWVSDRISRGYNRFGWRIGITTAISSRSAIWRLSAADQLEILQHLGAEAGSMVFRQIFDAARAPERYDGEIVSELIGWRNGGFREGFVSDFAKQKGNLRADH